MVLATTSVLSEAVFCFFAGDIFESGSAFLIERFEVLEDDRSLDPLKMKKYRDGRSGMAEDARSRDGQTTVNRKKV